MLESNQQSRKPPVGKDTSPRLPSLDRSSQWPGAFFMGVEAMEKLNTTTLIRITKKDIEAAKRAGYFETDTLSWGREIEPGSGVCALSMEALVAERHGARFLIYDTDEETGESIPGEDIRPADNKAETLAFAALKGWYRFLGFNTEAEYEAAILAEGSGFLSRLEGVTA